MSPQCYYIGATEDAATKIINEVAKPLAHHIPVEKVCEKLKKKDSQICELKYGECGRPASSAPLLDSLPPPRFCWPSSPFFSPLICQDRENLRERSR